MCAGQPMWIQCSAKSFSVCTVASFPADLAYAIARDFGVRTDFDGRPTLGEDSAFRMLGYTDNYSKLVVINIKWNRKQPVVFFSTSRN